MVSVVIPALNEESTIGGVIGLALDCALTREVLVIDDGSTDATVERARQAGARVVMSTMLGKGASMADGIREANHELILFLDGDLSGLEPRLVDTMVQPLLREEADIVKASFTREAGRVTTLTAKPLLHSFFPELDRFEQPLGGIVAARRSLLASLCFDDDYGVDVGLLIDAMQAGARVTEVQIGHIEHDSQSLTSLGLMAGQVVRTILDRAERYGRLESSYLAEVREGHRHMEAEPSLLLHKLTQPGALLLVPMDYVLLQGSYVEELAHQTGKKDQLRRVLRQTHLPVVKRLRGVARIFAGVPQQLFESVAREAPLSGGAVEGVVALRRLGWHIGVIDNCFFIATEIIRRRVFADFSVANLTVFEKGVCTGELVFAPAMSHPEGCKHQYCKSNLLGHLAGMFHTPPAMVAAVGVNGDDICLLKRAGLPIAAQRSSTRIKRLAQTVLLDGLEILPRLLPQPTLSTPTAYVQ